MSASSRGGSTSRGASRGRGRGRPSRLELLRREALADAQAELPDLAAGAPRPARAAPEQGLVPHELPAPGIGLSPVPPAMIASFRAPLPARPTHPLGQIVLAYAEAARANMPQLEQQRFGQFATDFWAPHSNVWHSVAVTAKAHAIGQDRSTIRSNERRLAAVAELAEREVQQRVVTQLALASESTGVELLCFIEGARYDEATAILSVDQPSRDFLTAAGISPDQIAPALQAALDQNIAKESVPAKIFQTDSQWFALLAVATGDPARPKRYILISSDAVTCPQILQQNNAECVAQALVALSTVRPQTVSKYRWKMRLVCSDRGASNMAAERLIQLTRPDWHNLFFPCEIHMSTGASGKGLSLMDHIVTTLIRTALSLRLGGWMRVFRRCMLEEVFATLEVLEGAPLAEATAHRRKAMGMFLKVGGHSRKQRAILACLPNGDWRLTDRVQVFVPPNTEWDRLTISLMVAKALVTALAGSNFKVFNRNRWTNNDAAVNQFGLLESCHMLFTRSYKRWLLAVGYDGPLKHLLVEAAAADPLVPPVPAAALAMLEDAAADAPGEHADADDAIGEGRGEDDVGEAGAYRNEVDDMELAVLAGLPEATDHKVMNAKHRAAGAAWVLQGCPLRDLVVARVTIEPSMAMLRRQLHVASNKWEVQQDQILAGGDVQRRDYRLLVCARGEMDTMFSRHQMHLFWSPALLSVVPAAARTEEMACLSFRMAARVGAEHERLLASRHRKPPFTLFLATQSRQVAQQLQATYRSKPCLLDSFSREFMDAHSLENADALAILRAIMAISHVDTALIECWHAWSRRVTTRLGTQTHRPSQSDVFARHVAQRVKRRVAHAEEWMHPGDGADDNAAEEHGVGGAGDVPGGAPRKRKGGGGSYRAHMSKRLRAGDTMVSAAAAYGARTADEITDDREAGQLATARHRAGEVSFGQSAREALRDRITSAATVFNRAHPIQGHQTFLGITDNQADPSLRECTAQNYDFMLKVVRKADFLVAAEKKKMEAQLRQASRLFAAGRGKAMRDAIVRDIPALSDIRDYFSATPTDDNTLACERLHVTPESDQVSIRAMSIDQEEGHARSNNRNLGVAADAYWAARIRPIAPDEWTGPPDVPSKEGRCFLAGHCLCCADGKKLLAFRNRFIANQKLLTMKDTPDRELLKQGALVWMLRGVPHESLFEGLAACDDESSGDIDECTYILWHAAAMLFKPYIPAFHALECDSLDRGEQPAPYAQLAVKAIGWVDIHS